MHDNRKILCCRPPSCRCIVISKNTPLDISVDTDNSLDIYDNDIEGLLLKVESIEPDKIVDKLGEFISKLSELIDSGEIHNHLHEILDRD